MKVSFSATIRKLFLELKLFPLFKLPPSGHRPAFRNQMGFMFFHLFPVYSVLPLPQVISFTGCVALVPSQDMASGPHPTWTVLLCTLSLSTWFSAQAGRQLCSVQCGVLLDWRLQMWGHPS